MRRVGMGSEGRSAVIAFIGLLCRLPSYQLTNGAVKGKKNKTKGWGCRGDNRVGTYLW